MDGFCEWFVSNMYSNIVTVLSVAISGFISLAITAIYYHMGNRNNLKMSIIYPIKRLLEEPYTRKNYDKLCDLSKEFSSKYLHKSEKKIILLMLEAYKEVSKYNEICVNADSLFSYFGYTLKKNGIEPKVCPITDIEGNLIAYDYPSEVNYLAEDIKSVLTEQEDCFDQDDCESSVINLYRHYCENYYGTNKIVFFSDYSFNQVLGMSKTRKKRDKTFDKMRELEEKFLHLRIAREF